ncbi:hypothetical protein SeMB42_g07249 [Synchytrium endobioticum]|uniref:Uncharacterized protein n=1 Tax=Synchytrium endobioticum TaxID=286115 RepID=A0A507CAC9_9FUNG|nr:hypothetical protein SeMB42_g07249 [Synchytrium endobioticum]
MLVVGRRGMPGLDRVWTGGGDFLSLSIELDLFDEDFAEFYAAEMVPAIEEAHKILKATSAYQIFDSPLVSRLFTFSRRKPSQPGRFLSNFYASPGRRGCRERVCRMMCSSLLFPL